MGTTRSIVGIEKHIELVVVDLVDLVDHFKQRQEVIIKDIDTLPELIPKAN